MNDLPDYDVAIKEIHHSEKMDAPSGTAITLAEDILEQVGRKQSWVKDSSSQISELVIRSLREGKVPGTHTIQYGSAVDKLSIRHEAISRKGFATGALLAASWIQGKRGIFGMDDVLNLKFL